MKEWTEIIRDHRFFNLMVLENDGVETDESFPIATNTGGIKVQYDMLYPVTKSKIPDAPNYVAVSEIHSLATQDSSPYNLIPHAADPAPAQRAGNIAFIWGRKQGGTVIPYREDGFPAVVIAVGISKYYQYGVLTRKRQHPAIKAEYLAAMWYEKRGEDSYRGNGPASISFENYKEFWIDGEFKGHRWTDYHLNWNHRILNTPDDEDTLGNFLGDLRGTTNMFSDIYFTDGTDEVCYITDFS
jgi:hypothetical protein